MRTSTEFLFAGDFADEVILDDRLAELVKTHLAAGKSLLATGRSGLNPEGSAFGLKKNGGEIRASANTYRLFRLIGEFAARVPTCRWHQYQRPQH